MVYDYLTEKKTILTDEGQRSFLRIRDNVHALLQKSGAVKMSKAIIGSGDGWFLMACVDRLVELGEITEITGPDVCGQDRVFVSTK